ACLPHGVSVWPVQTRWTETPRHVGVLGLDCKHATRADRNVVDVEAIELNAVDDIPTGELPQRGRRQLLAERGVSQVPASVVGLDQRAQPGEPDNPSSRAERSTDGTTVRDRRLERDHARDEDHVPTRNEREQSQVVPNELPSMFPGRPQRSLTRSPHWFGPP